MRGRVLSFNGSTGLISGDDGKRYTFSASDLMGEGAYLPAGSTVDFDGEDGVASSVYVLGLAPGDKNRFLAAVLACPFSIGAGMLGLHKFYLGRTKAGIIMLVGTCLGITAPLVAIIAFLEMIIYLVKTDQSFYEDYVVGDKSWF